MTSGQRVLLVDGLTETEAVLKAVLEPRGMEVNRIRRNSTLGGSPPASRPNLVVLHAEGEAAEDSPWGEVPQIVIGTADIAPLADTVKSSSERYLSQPFQYADLILAIEQLLARPEAQADNGPKPQSRAS